MTLFGQTLYSSRMKVHNLLLTLAISLNAAAASAGQSEISVKLGKLADTLVAAYGKTPGALEKPKAAVLTFNTSKELEKRRIGFAVSEILSHNLAGKGSFVLLERTELNRVFDELKLNMAGVTNQADALKAGKLASAELLVMGSVEKFDGTYHVNARLVRTETGEVLATAYEELPVAAFELEARDYVVLVPKTQTIGIYLLYNFRGTAKLSPMTSPAAPGSYAITTTPLQPALCMPGFGVRYTPFEHAMLDVSLTNTGTGKQTGHVRYYNSGAGFDYTEADSSKFSLLRAVAGMTDELGKGLSYYLGAGASSVRISGFGGVSYVTPTVLARVEYHLQQRIGISVAAGYDFTTKAAANTDWLAAGLKTAELQHFYFEPSISVYF